jgi:hypothetical protein
MGKTYTHKKLKAEFVLPDPLLGPHWEKYSREVPADEAEAFGNVQYVQALRVIESGQCEGFPDLKAAGLNVPLGVIMWVARTVDEAFAAAIDVPKG